MTPRNFIFLYLFGEFLQLDQPFLVISMSSGNAKMLLETSPSAMALLMKPPRPPFTTHSQHVMSIFFPEASHPHLTPCGQQGWLEKRLEITQMPESQQTAFRALLWCHNNSLSLSGPHFPHLRNGWLVVLKVYMSDFYTMVFFLYRKSYVYASYIKCIQVKHSWLKTVDEESEDGEEDMQIPFQCFPMPHQEAPDIASREFKMSLRLYWCFLFGWFFFFWPCRVRLVGS